MSKYKIAVLPGDGTGKDVMEAARIVLDKIELEAEYVEGDIGWEFWCEEGNPLPDRTIQMLKETDVCLFAAITSKPKEDALKELHPKHRDKGYSYFSPIVRLRQEFDLYTNLRPCKAYPGNPLNYRDDIDLVIFRENTEGMYAGVEFHPLPEEIRDALLLHPKMRKFKDTPLEEIALSTRIMTKKGCTRILRQAFEYAKKNKRRSVTIVEKPNVLRETGGLILDIAREMSKEYPEVEFWETNVDAMAMWLVKNPQDYDVLVAENLFGDIITDLAAMIQGGMGIAAGANINPQGVSMFEPIGGSAPKYTGKNIINPIAAILSAQILLETIGEAEAADRVEKAVIKVLRDDIKDVAAGKMGYTTDEVGDLVAQYVGSL